jgi:hypothetical protein
MNTCSPYRSGTPGPGFLDAREPRARWRQWAAAVIPGLPVLASAAPLLGVSGGSL